MLIVFGFFAIGDFMGVVSKARISSVFVALMLFLVCFVVGILPGDIIDRAQLTQIANISTSFLVFNMGTNVNLRQICREWKIVVMSCLAMAVAVAAVFLVSPIIGLQSAIVSIPIVNGGLVATKLMTGAALEKGFASAAALGVLVFAVQKFVGTIPASRCGLSEAKILSKQFQEAQAAGIDLLKEAATQGRGESKKTPFYAKHEKYYTVYMILAIAALVALMSFGLSKLTGLASAIWNMALGMLFNQLGLCPPGILDKGKVSGFCMVGTFCSLIPALADISIGDLAGMAVQVCVIFGAVLAGTFLVFYFLPCWKFVGSRNLAIGVAMSQLLGFPATLLIVNEVATAVAGSPEEKTYITNKLTPAFVVSGFVSVTTISVFVASLFVNFL